MKTYEIKAEIKKFLAEHGSQEADSIRHDSQRVSELASL